MSTYNTNNAFNLLAPIIVGLHLFQQITSTLFAPFILRIQPFSTLSRPSSVDPDDFRELCLKSAKVQYLIMQLRMKRNLRAMWIIIIINNNIIIMMMMITVKEG